MQYNTVKHNSDVIRVDLLLYSMELTIIDEKRTKLAGYISVEPKLKYLEENFIEILSRQYIKK
jgi:hypothetical protein